MVNKSKNSTKSSKKSWTLAQTLPYILVIGGIIGFVMSFIITIEKIHLLQDPSFIPECNINPIISCGNIMKSDQAGAFGFPNPLIGIMGFSVVITIGMAMLAGAKFKRWFWQGLQVGTILGVAFCMWLFYQAVYRIGSLCPYCIVVWMATIPIFLYTTIYNIRQGHIVVKGKVKAVADFVGRHHGDIIALWYILIAAAILKRFWYYWQTLL